MGTVDANGAACTPSQIAQATICQSPFGFKASPNKDVTNVDFGGAGTKASMENVKTFVSKLDTEYDFGGATLTSVTAFMRTSREIDQDQDGQPLALIWSNYERNAAAQFSEELRLSSNGDGPLKWQAGVFYPHMRHQPARMTSQDCPPLLY